MYVVRTLPRLNESEVAFPFLQEPVNLKRRKKKINNLSQLAIYPTSLILMKTEFKGHLIKLWMNGLGKKLLTTPSSQMKYSTPSNYK